MSPSEVFIRIAIGLTFLAVLICGLTLAHVDLEPSQSEPTAAP